MKRLAKGGAMIRAVVWNEFVHERENSAVRSIYPEGIHAVIAAALDADAGIDASTATLDQPENGLPADSLRETDVLLWWGHKARGRVDEATVDRVVARVHKGMGLIVLHSGHFSKPFIRLMLSLIHI